MSSPVIAPFPVDLATSRTVSGRYFNLYRLALTTIFVVFGVQLEFGLSGPVLYFGTTVVYWVFAVVCVILAAVRPRTNVASLGFQVWIDLLALAVLMYSSGGYRSGIPFLMMITVAATGLVGQGRIVLGAAAFATIAVLIEQSARVALRDMESVDFSRAAIISVGFFAVAFVARMLSRRALANEALALKRGADLERQMRVNARIIEDMQDGVLVLDEQGAVRQFNPRAAELLGEQLLPGDRLEDINSGLYTLVSAPTLSEQAVFRADGGRRSLSLRRIPVGSGGDTILYLEDFDRVHARAQQLKLAALGRLTANIAHEIRNPLSSISHAGDLLRDEKRTAMQQRLIRIIHDNSARIERMIRDVLELGRRDRALAEAISLEPFLKALLEEFTLQTPKVADSVAMEILGDCIALFDRVHLYQIVSNLLVNAVRYCSGSPGSILLVARQIDSEQLELAIKDDGPGIPAEDRVKVFEPFFTSDPKGTGLGLYMARELAEANGGQLSLVDAEGGAEFVLTMRRAT